MLLTKIRNYLTLVIVGVCAWSCTNQSTHQVREILDFNAGWKFALGDYPASKEPSFDDSSWRMLDLPHDWSIEGEFSETNPAGVGGGALPGGIGWYRKSFAISQADADKKIYIQFDGAYRNSEVWINGQWLGKRPNGYINFQYDLTPHLKIDQRNIVAVRVDNADQPNSRWYSGSGIYRDVVLIKTGRVHVDYLGTYIRTPVVTYNKASATLSVTIRNTLSNNQAVKVNTAIVKTDGSVTSKTSSDVIVTADTTATVDQQFELSDPVLWSVDSPYLYRAITEIVIDGKIVDEYETTFGVRSFAFDAAKGFSLNGEPMKLRGVCLHHDFGCLGAAFYERAAERQLEIMKAMGVNAIRTSHNPPASRLLDLCDRMGFIVMDEAFDMWKKQKVDYDYHLYWDEWHRRDLEDQLRRDRNHASVMIWSIGNEVNEQWDVNDSLGTVIATELAGIVRSLDDARPITAGCNNQNPDSPVIRSGVLDLIGYNYAHQIYKDFPTTYSGQKFIATETNSSLATRGYYDMPSDSVRIWPIAWDKPFNEGNADHTVSAYDNARTPWGSTQEETWKLIKNNG
ncbi:MAG: glycoside hydrolase family 2 protein, partial [Bacteroidia bacterium]|nr:glycoside hydrolase family 2 protein [Bacteroidia bacterium]